MIFDDMGLPRDNGATDFNDSARLAGILALFQYPVEKEIDLTLYIDDNWKYVRHPKEYKYDFSRDQAIPLMAGLWIDFVPYLVDRNSITGKDFLSPSVRGHIRRCQDREANWFQNLWLKLDIYWNAFCDPLSEPNQLICMLMVAGTEYLKMWTKLNPMWRDAIHAYWTYSFRNEPELARHMIKRIEGMCEKKS